MIITHYSIKVFYNLCYFEAIRFDDDKFKIYTFIYKNILLIIIV